jgi:hypothetical protein
MPELSELSGLPKFVALAANDLIPGTDASIHSPYGVRSKAIPAALVAQGFTHAFVVNFNNAELLTQGTDDTDEVITLMAIPANTVVEKARLVVTQAFTGLTAVNVFVGRTADADGYIASTSALAKTVAQNSGAEIDTVNEIDFISAYDQNLLITFDPAANGEALDELTAGQVVVLVSLTSVDDYLNLVPV